MHMLVCFFAGVIQLISRSCRPFTFIGTNYFSDNEFLTINALKDILGVIANLVALFLFIF